MLNKYNLVTFLIVFFFITSANSQAPAIEWQRCYGGAFNQVGYGVQQTIDGGYITCGSFGTTNENYWIMKLGATGNVEWERQYGGSLGERAIAIQQTSDNGYIVAGSTASNNSGDVGINHGNEDYWIVKLNSVGDISWQKVLGGSNTDAARSIQQTTDGGYIVSGQSNSTDGDITGNHGIGDCWIVKLDANGNLQWQRSYGGSANDEGTSVKQTADGGYIVAGFAVSTDGDVFDPGSIGGYAWILKLDATGNIQWQKKYGSNIYGTVARSICLTSDGGYAFAGQSNGNGGNVTGNHGSSDFWVVKLDASGNFVWQNSLGGTGFEIPTCIIESADNGLVVVGYGNSTNGDITGNHGGMDVWAAKLSSTGTLLWQRALGGTGGEFGNCIYQAADMGYIIAGYTNSNNSGDVGSNPDAPTNDTWIIKLASDLVPVTLTNFDATAKGNDVLCSWKTQQEQNSSHFIVERSDGGLRFNPMGTIAAAGSSALPRDYSFTDRNAVAPGKKFLFYRLKMVDVDGSFTYSRIARIGLGEASTLSIYPNPVGDPLYVSFTSGTGEAATLSVINDIGETVYQRPIVLLKGNNTFIVPVRSLPPAGYTLLLKGQKTYQAGFVVSR